MQDSFKNFFQKESMFVGSVIAASILWVSNAGFNFYAKDYRACCINLLYVICLIIIYRACNKGENKVIQGSIGALMMISVMGNVNVMTEMIETSVPSRAFWQMLFGTVLTFALFMNHFMIHSDDRRTLRLIQMNQIIILVLMLFRVFQIVMNIVVHGFSVMMIEMTVGLLAIIPTLNVIVCVELKTDAYNCAN